MTDFVIKLETKEDHISAQGSLLVAPPNRFRIELRGPIGPAALVVACDGATLVAWNTMKSLAWRGDDAEAALRSLTGNAAGVDAVVSLLLGRIPAIGTPTWTGEMFRWDGPGGEIVTAVAEAKRARLVRVQAADAAGRLLLSASYTPGAEPEALVVQLPTLGATADVAFGAWSPAEPSDAVFRLTIPESVAVSPFPTPPPQ